MADEKQRRSQTGEVDATEPQSLAKQHDIVLVQGRTQDGAGLRALRSRPERLELAEIRPAREGHPLQGSAELVQLRPRKESPLLYDVDVQYAPDAAEEGARGGPAQVATQKYRDNWDVVFGKKARGKQMLN